MSGDERGKQRGDARLSHLLTASPLAAARTPPSPPPLSDFCSPESGPKCEVNFWKARKNPEIWKVLVTEKYAGVEVDAKLSTTTGILGKVDINDQNHLYKLQNSICI